MANNDNNNGSVDALSKFRLSRDGIRQETVAATASHYLDLNSGAVVPSISTSTTFARDDRYRLLNAAHGYSRDDSPTFLPAEQTLADLENAEACCLFASGMAAISAVMRASGSGATLVVPDSLYWGVFSWVNIYAKKNDVSIVKYHNGSLDSLQLELDTVRGKGIRPDLVWIESPSNPFLHVMDIKAAADAAHSVDSVLCVDSTAATPVLSRPLDLGADYVVHSATKYLNGHSDALCGAVLCREANDAWQVVCEERHLSGAVPGNLEAWLLSRGMRTLFLRVAVASNNAAQVAAFLENHSKVSRVYYPGLQSHPCHDIAREQMHGGYGGLLSFEVDGDASAALAVAGALELILSATSLGGVESLIEHRASVEPPETGVPENLLRLAVGIEHIDDLVDDLTQALSQI